ncbi:PTS sugar transporter subunit IIB [Lentilactobacillus sp. SPB1-3]|uniref:PTS sugar transporter subunit IIB n=1 Tax=Lentilactobacillus terminaliae TaxID=3003483 RepID=A0ACD5DGX0_9LACO|nr:PTS lactose transporter subunit IIB [Lentilactobacillus sp. SPB1-3]MCZ0976857.1 PTS lactose transporter subunit IIB [Lentilactobacillus sp. SPB1-3]
MKNVMLLCENGISSNFLERSAKRFMEITDAQFNLVSADITSADKLLSSGVDLVLIAPQVTYRDEELEIIGDRAPVMVIPDDVYGWANGERLVKFINQNLATEVQAV